MIDSNEEDGFSRVGSAILFGILSFLVLEKILELSNPETNPQLREASNKKIVGYLNLLANCTDNLLHGLAVGTSFLTSFKLGVTTTAAILLHEIPHEFGDFAILLKSGFERWEAAKAQMLTAMVGMLGATLALMFESSSHLEHMLMYILPFTAGGFLNIALVSLVPDLMQVRNYFKQNYFNNINSGEESTDCILSIIVCGWWYLCHVSTDPHGMNYYINTDPPGLKGRIMRIEKLVIVYSEDITCVLCYFQ